MSSDDSVPKADGLKLAEICDRILERSEGGRPIRKRGFYRAFKSGKIWAQLEQIHREMLNNLGIQLFYGSENRNEEK